jgi:hypothetical protein
VGPDCTTPIGPDGKVCASATAPGAELTPVQIERTVLLLTDQRAFGGSGVSCATPDHAIVFYDDKDAPVAWVELSLSCGNLMAKPALPGIAKKDNRHPLTGAALGFLRPMCNKFKLTKCEAAKTK